MKNRLIKFIPVLIFAIFNLLMTDKVLAQKISLKKEIVVIKNVTVIDMKSPNALSEMTVVIAEGKIVEIEKTVKTVIPKNSIIIDAQGKYLIPGLWDMHVHISSQDELYMHLSNGVTSIRDMGSDIKKVGVWRDLINTGKMLGPRIKTAGSVLESPAEIESLRQRGETEYAKWRISVPDPASAQNVVDEVRKSGADFIKARSFVSVETYRAIAEAAQRSGLMFVGHPPFGLKIEPDDVSNLKQQTLEHGFYPYEINKLSPERLTQIEQAYLRNNTILVPSLVAWEWRSQPLDAVTKIGSTLPCEEISPLIRTKLTSRWAVNLKDRLSESKSGQETAGTIKIWNSVLSRNYQDIATLQKKGVQIMPGTDEPPFLCPNGALVRELELFVGKLGMTPQQALESATVQPAELFGMKNILGTIEVGKKADLVLLNANPLDNISNLRLIQGVMVNGIYNEPGQIRDLLQNIQTQNIAKVNQTDDLQKRIEQLSSPHPLERAAAAYSFGKKQNSSVAAIPHLIKLLGDGTPVDPSLYGRKLNWGGADEKREFSPGKEAAISLAERGTPSVEPLISALETTKDWRFKMNAIWVLGAIREKGATEIVAKFIDDDSPQVRLQAVWATGIFNNKKSASKLRNLLTNETDKKVMEQIVWALGMLNDKEAVDLLKTTLRDPNGNVRQQSAWALGMISSNEAATVLQLSLKDSNQNVRQQSAWALGMIGANSAVSDLLISLKDESPHVREQSAWALGMIGNNQAIEGMIAALNDENKNVREQVKKSLQMLVKNK